MKFNFNNSSNLFNILILCIIIICSYIFVYFKTNRDLLDGNRAILMDNNRNIKNIGKSDTIIFNQIKIIGILKESIDSIFENQKITIDNQKEIIFNQRQILFNQRQILFNQNIKKNK